MPYAILPEDPSVEAALRRIAIEEAGDAVEAALGGGDLAPRVHAMRKSVKKLRALLRLVAPVLPPARKADARLRDAGRRLGDLRDAAVRLDTLEGIAADMGPERRDRLLAPFLLAARRQEEEADADALPGFAQAMATMAERSRNWRLRRDGWRAIGPGLSATHDAARRTMRRALRTGRPRDVHDFRKRAKDHWYHARLLRPIWPEAMAPHVRAADDLGELLGRINDLSVLRACLPAAGLDDALLSEAEARADRRRAELMGQAAVLAPRLLADRPDALAARWRTWWDLRAPSASEDAR